MAVELPYKNSVPDLFIFCDPSSPALRYHVFLFKIYTDQFIIKTSKLYVPTLLYQLLGGSKFLLESNFIVVVLFKFESWVKRRHLRPIRNVLKSKTKGL